MKKMFRYLCSVLMLLLLVSVKSEAAKEEVNAVLKPKNGKTMVTFELTDKAGGATNATVYRTIGFSVTYTTGKENEKPKEGAYFLLEKGESNTVVDQEGIATTTYYFSYENIEDCLEKAGVTDARLKAAGCHVYLNAVMESGYRDGNGKYSKRKGPYYTLDEIKHAEQWSNPEDLADHFNISVPFTIPVFGYAYLYDGQSKYSQASGVKSSDGHYTYNSRDDWLEQIKEAEKISDNSSDITSGGYVVPKAKQPPKTIVSGGATYYLYGTRWTKAVSQGKEISVASADTTWHQMPKVNGKEQLTQTSAITEEDFKGSQYQTDLSKLLATTHKFPLTKSGLNVIYLYRKGKPIRQQYSYEVNGYVYLYDAEENAWKQPQNAVMSSDGSYTYNSARSMVGTVKTDKYTLFSTGTASLKSGEGVTVSSGKQPKKTITENGETYYLCGVRCGEG
ncbi:MAG: hypothetical protein K6G65_00970 [Lachnospiraceae bacterium]|nr:hypothetical protein [Lachnospiraceae bacterium]